MLLLEDGSLKKDDGIIFPTGTFYKDLVGTKTAALKKCVITFPLATLTKGIMLRLNFILGLIFVFPLQVIFHTHSKDSLNQDTSNLYQGPCTIRHAWVQLYYPSKYFA